MESAPNESRPFDRRRPPRILARGVRHTGVGRMLLRVSNRTGIFANLGDDLDGLERALARRLDRFELETVGAVALFAGWPR